MVFANVEMYYGENKGISLISIICSVLNIVLNILFIPRFGYFAAGWTTLFSYMLLTLLHYILMKRACRKNGIEEGIFQNKLLLGISAGVTASAFAAMGMYRLSFLRYVPLALVLLMLLAFRKKVLSVVWEMEKERKTHEE